jgi:hypothetical protein
MKLLLNIYSPEWAATEIQAAWVELTPPSLESYLALKHVFDKLGPESPSGLSLSTITYVDWTPDFLAPVYCGTEEDEFSLIDESGNEITLYLEDDYVILRDDQEFPEESPQKMTITYLNVEKQGIWWESRDDATEDKVETTLLTWELLASFKAKMEAAARGSNA